MFTSIKFSKIGIKFALIPCDWKIGVHFTKLKSFESCRTRDQNGDHAHIHWFPLPSIQ
jgi:hypothetical protein